jgi:thiol:disulfide interchange protein DsbC
MTDTALRGFLLGTFLCAALPALAADPAVEAIQKELAVTFPEVKTEQLSPSPIPGLFELRVGPQVAYVSADGRYLVHGDIIEVSTDNNITEARRSVARLGALADVGESKMVIFEPKQVKHTINVFTDVDCTYCRKLHRDINQYLAQGIRVRYLFFPRSGPNTESWTKAEQVWCSPDRNAALTKAKRGEVLTTKVCSPTPVQQHYSLGLTFGVTGTPAIVTEKGEILPGYLSPSELEDYLDGKTG